MEESHTMRKLPVAGLILILSQSVQAAPNKKVRIDFVEALSPKDTTSSERFQKDYEAAINLGKSLLKSKLEKCGYELDTQTTFYEASDALKGKEVASKLNTEGSWLIVGPRRSNHYLLLAQGSGTTPTVSLMASADDVSKLDRIHSSISPSNSEMAEIAVKEAKRRFGKSASYMTVVSDDCTACVDFSKAFDRSANTIGFKKLGDVSVHAEIFDTAPIISAINSKSPTIVLVPNYSKVAARVMGAFNNAKKPPFFIGGDGWGDQRYGFLQVGDPIDHVSGFTVRGFPPVEQGLKSFPLGAQALSKKNELPFAAPSLGTLKILEETAHTLCSSRPGDREAFSEAFTKSGHGNLHAPWGVSVYELKAGQISFNKTVRGK